MSRSVQWPALALTVLVLVPLWAVEHPPLQDYPYHLVRAEILAHYADPGAAYAETFTRSFYPTPYLLADLLVAGAGHWTSVELAGRLVLSLYLLLFPWSLLYLLRSIDPEKEVLGLTGFLWVYNWHFHMGFVSYALSLVPALIAFGFWWRRQRALPAARPDRRPRHGADEDGTGQLGWSERGLLALLVLVTYLLHVYSFGILLFALCVAAVVEGWRSGRLSSALRSLGEVLLAAAPALLLGAGTVARSVAASAAGGGGGEGPLLLLYGGLTRKVLLALGALPSFSLAWETTLFALAVALAVVLGALGWRRGRRPEPALVAVAVALGILYLALPDHVGRVFFVANRVPLYLLFFGLALLPAPPRRWRAPAAAAFALLACLHMGALAVRYLEIDRRLDDYRAALELVPDDARAAFRVHRPSTDAGRIAPAALFGGYHYLDAPGDRIPDLEHFVGTLRAVDYRREAGGALSTASTGSREELTELLSRPWLVGPGGLLVVVGDGGAVAPVARETGFRRLGRAGPVALWRKARARPDGRATPPVADRPLPEDPWYATGYQEGFDHLVAFGAPGAGEPPLPEGFEPVAREGWAAVYRPSTWSATRR